MADISCFIYDSPQWNIDLLGSGLGFYGSAFGGSVAVGSYQDTTYVTDSTGVTQGAQCNNVKWRHASSGEVAGGVILALQNIPNHQAPLNIRFTHTSGVQVQNVEARIYDRSNINSAAVGVTTKMAELIHVNTSQANTGSGDATWYTPAGSSIVVPLADSPGASGLYAQDGDGSPHEDTRHDWYVAISARPDSIGSKTSYGLYCSLEYL